MPLALVTLVVGALIDRLLKTFSIVHPEVTTPLVGHFFQFATAANPAGPLGLTIPTPMLLVVATVLGSLLLWTSRAITQPALRIALLFLVLGVLSNMIDRLTVGYIIDTFTLWGLAFNIADLFILGGALFAGWRMWRG